MLDLIEIGDGEILRWFSGVFARELTPEGVEACRAGAAEPFLEAIGERCDAGPVAESFRAAISGWSSTDEAYRRLALQFSELFLLPGPNSAPPYASAYEGGGGRSFGTVHERMSERLKTSGLQVAWNTNEPADHLSIILELASAVGSGAGASECGRLLDADLNGWLNQFRNKVRQSQSGAGFYGAVVELLWIYIQALSAPSGRVSE